MANDKLIVRRKLVIRPYSAELDQTTPLHIRRFSNTHKNGRNCRDGSGSVFSTERALENLVVLAIRGLRVY